MFWIGIFIGTAIGFGLAVLLATHQYDKGWDDRGEVEGWNPSEADAGKEFEDD